MMDRPGVEAAPRAWYALVAWQDLVLPGVEYKPLFEDAPTQNGVV